MKLLIFALTLSLTANKQGYAAIDIGLQIVKASAARAIDSKQKSTLFKVLFVFYLTINYFLVVSSWFTRTSRRSNH